MIMTKKNYSEPRLKIILIDTDQMLLAESYIGQEEDDCELGVKGHRRGFSWDDEDEEY